MFKATFEFKDTVKPKRVRDIFLMDGYVYMDTFWKEKNMKITALIIHGSRNGRLMLGSKQVQPYKVFKYFNINKHDVINNKVYYVACYSQRNKPVTVNGIEFIPIYRKKKKRIMQFGNGKSKRSIYVACA